MNSNIHIAIALLSLTIGYPLLGMGYTLILAPYLFYMVISADAKYLPALVVHCAADNSATFIIFLSMIVMSVLKYKYLFSMRLKWIFIALFVSLPIMLFFVVQRIVYFGDYTPVAVSHISLYLSFFGFFYGVLISKSMNNNISKQLLYTLFIVYMFSTFNLVGFVRISTAFVSSYVAYVAISIKQKKKNYLVFFVAVIVLIQFFQNIEESTLSTLGIVLFSFFLSYLMTGENNLKYKLTGILPFILILILYAIGIYKYKDVGVINSLGHIDLSSWDNLRNRVMYKFFNDRAPYWAGGFWQIIKHRNFFPDPAMPDIIAQLSTSSYIQETFGAHTTFIELIRKFGIFVGLTLSYCLIYFVIISRKYFKYIRNDVNFIPLYASALATTIIISLAGIFEILPNYSLMSIGILGVAYGKSQIMEKIGL